jgi:hypothetical protein
MGKYAEGTGVSAESSQQEIQRLLRRYNADGFMVAWEQHRATIGFKAHGRMVRFVLPLPTDHKAFSVSDGGRRRTDAAARSAMDAEIRRLWRSLCMAIKAKLEVVESGIATFEEEFMAQIVMPDGQSFASHATPAIAAAYENGGPPVLALESGR